MSAIDLVAVWDVPMNHGVYTVEFEHGTLTGKRIIRVNGKVRNERCRNPHVLSHRPMSS